MPERATVMSRSEKSAEAMVVAVAGPMRPEAKQRRAEGMGGPTLWLSEVKKPQMFVTAKLAIVVDRVKPDRPRQRRINSNSR